MSTYTDSTGATMNEAAPPAARRDTVRDADVARLLGSITVEMLRATFDHWTIAEREDDGRLLAIRSGCFVADGPRSLIRGCVLADTTTGLAEQLGIQVTLESLTAAELEAVWRDGPAAAQP
jgi:hypothetical protein